MRLPPDQYEDYIRSDAWQERRLRALERAGHKCQLCSSSVRLCVHHNTYDRLGNELDTDLTVLCKRCHDKYHAEIDPRTVQKYQRRTVEVKVTTETLPMPAARPQPSPAEAGKVLRVTVDKHYRDALIGPGNAVTARGARLLGEKWPPKTGWAQRCLGRRIDVSADELRAELELVEAKRSIKGYRKCPIGTRSENHLTDKDKSDIRAFLARHHQKAHIKSLAKRFRVSKRTIREIWYAMPESRGRAA